MSVHLNLGCDTAGDIHSQFVGQQLGVLRILQTSFSTYQIKQVHKFVSMSTKVVLIFCFKNILKLISKLKTLTLSVHYEPLNSN